MTQFNSITEIGKFILKNDYEAYNRIGNRVYLRNYKTKGNKKVVVVNYL